MGGYVRLLLAVVLVGLDTWSISSILGSRSRRVTRAFWVALVLLLPFLGFVLWLMIGPGRRSPTR
ncbi:MAG TPA: PLD nuclease N-terminal domain-containing protein [Longimicrobiales bacterium]|nr:PLD nuclease N-terminal domain-containing protein [Longimicrobiales bacterium]